MSARHPHHAIPALLLTLVLAVASCTSTNEKLERMVPSDAIGVAAVNMPQLLQKSGIEKDGIIKVPKELLEVLDRSNGSSIFTFLVERLASSGIDTKAKVYVFFTPKTFRSVTLLPVADDDKMRHLVESFTGKKFDKKHGIPFIMSNNEAFVLSDGVLLIGSVSDLADAGDAAAKAKAIINGDKESLFKANEKVRKCLNNNDAVDAYFDMKGLASLLNKDEAYRTLSQDFPLMAIITDSDIECLTCSVTLGDDNTATFKTHFDVPEKSEYVQLLDQTLSTPSNDFLSAIPSSMDCIMGVSVKGDNFVKLEQFQQLTRTLNDQGGLAGIDFTSMLNTVNGPFALALSPDQTGGWDIVLAATTVNPDVAVKQVVDFAKKNGQDPVVRDSIYYYEVDSKQVKMGVKDNVFYIKMLGYEDDAYEPSSGFPDAMEMFGSKRIAIFAKPKIGDKPAGYLNFGLKNATDGDGLFYTHDPKDNVALSLIELLCSMNRES